MAASSIRVFVYDLFAVAALSERRIHSAIRDRRYCFAPLALRCFPAALLRLVVMSSEVETSLIIGLARNAEQNQEIPRLRLGTTPRKRQAWLTFALAPLAFCRCLSA